MPDETAERKAVLTVRERQDRLRPLQRHPAESRAQVGCTQLRRQNCEASNNMKRKRIDTKQRMLGKTFVAVRKMCTGWESLHSDDVNVVQ